MTRHTFIRSSEGTWRYTIALMRKCPVASALVMWLALAASLCAQSSESAPAVEDSTGTTSQTAEPAPRLLLVVGAAGTPEYAEQFEQDAEQWRKLCSARKLDLTEIESEGGQSQRDQLQAAIATAAKDLQTEGTSKLWIVFIGHGTSERGVHKFNLVGNDVSSRELTEWLVPLSRGVVFINCSSASAPFLPELSAPGRVIVTATRSGSENNYSRFGHHLATSLLDPGTDIDHDEEVSLLEAFLAATAKTEQFYREQSRLATEHALIDDNGDKLGTGAEFFRGTRAVKAAQGGKAPDGDLASKIILYSDPSLPQLSLEDQARRSEIEAKIAELRAHKPEPPGDEYWDTLEGLLLELAKLYAGRE